MYNFAAAYKRLSDAEKAIKDNDDAIRQARSDRDFYSEDWYKKKELGAKIDELKALREPLRQAASSIRAEIDRQSSLQTAAKAKAKQDLDLSRAAASKLATINALQGKAGQDQIQETQAEQQSQYGAMQQVANAAAPTPPATAQQPQPPSGVLPAFTKFSGLGASQMRGQVSAPPQNVTGTQQNAFTLPNAQGLKFGGT
jgi:hypothetical protein